MDEMNYKGREALEVKHRKERKELQSRIQVLKKSATKGDKKKKKEVTEEITRLEQELDKKHEEELSQLEEPEYESCPQEIETTESPADAVTSNFKEIPQKASKAQKRRDKKAQQERERAREIEEQDRLNVHGARNVEAQTLRGLLRGRHLSLHEIPSDGNCLYCAIDHQLTQVGQNSVGLEKLRSLTSEFLLGHSNDFLPFMSHPETGDLLTEQQFQDYCTKVASTSAWGGEIELRALSHVLKKRIEVIQAVGPTIVVGEEYPEENKLMLTYHRHMYGLGEHYNSVKAFVEPEALDGV